jgi:hypothetical protein
VVVVVVVVVGRLKHIATTYHIRKEVSFSKAMCGMLENE